MFNSTTILSRFGISVAANIVRAAVSFISGLLIARGLQPASYGNYTFLLGSFVALRSIMDMGSSNAFFTFIAQKPRSKKFFLLYIIWLAVQFAFTVLLITLILPQTMIAKVWLGHPLESILLAFAACFLQQQAWTTINQIAESNRKTIWVQFINIYIGVAQIFLILLLWNYNAMSVITLFYVIIVEYVIAIMWAYHYFPDRNLLYHGVIDKFCYWQSILEYCRYCKPLLVYSCLMFIFEFYDRWLLQRFGGADQQGYYQIAHQFTAVSLLATSSILNIFWKEIAEAHVQGDKNRVAKIYNRVNRGLVMLAAITSGFLIPWTKEIVLIFLGPTYMTAIPVLMIMFLYPIHQAMGQIGSVMLLATENTRAYMKIGIYISLCFFPASYFMQAPTDFSPLPGLGLGAVGMAYKSVVINLISVNVMSWFIARICNWRYDWFFQTVGITSVICIGYIVKMPISYFFEIDKISNNFDVIVPMLVAFILYIGSILLLIWNMSWLIGVEKNELKQGVEQIISKLQK